MVREEVERRLEPRGTNIPKVFTSMVRKILAFGFAGLLVSVSKSAPLRLSVPSEKANLALLRDGKITGGQAGKRLSLLSVSRLQLGPDRERIVIQMGDHKGRPLWGKLGFFHVALDRQAQRVVIDLAQVQQTALDPHDLAKIMGSSKFVRDSDLTMDPHDGSTNMTLLLRQPTSIRVDSHSQAEGELVIELRRLDTSFSHGSHGSHGSRSL